MSWRIPRKMILKMEMVGGNITRESLFCKVQDVRVQRKEPFKAQIRARNLLESCSRIKY